MFGVSFSEILLISFISLVVFGPKQLPQIANKIGSLIFLIKRYFSSIREEIYRNSGFNQLTQAKLDLVESYQQIKQSIIINPTVQIHNTLIIEEPILYQAELDFECQPELELFQ